MSDHWSELQQSRRDWPRLREASTQFGISKYTLRRILKNGEVVGIQRGLARYWHVEPESLKVAYTAQRSVSYGHSQTQAESHPTH